MTFPFSMHPMRWALVAVVALDLLLIWWGAQLLSLPPIYQQLRARSVVLRYEPHMVVMAAVLLAAFAHAAAQKLLWLCRELYRWVSALLMAAALGVDALMHMLHIPHLEGWWLPLLGSGAVASFIAGMLHTRNKAGQD